MLKFELESARERIEPTFSMPGDKYNRLSVKIYMYMRQISDNYFRTALLVTSGSDRRFAERTAEH